MPEFVGITLGVLGIGVGLTLLAALALLRLRQFPGQQGRAWKGSYAAWTTYAVCIILVGVSTLIGLGSPVAAALMVVAVLGVVLGSRLLMQSRRRPRRL